jgi:hypothetical protein
MTRFRRFKRLRVIVDAEIKYLNLIGWQYGCPAISAPKQANTAK